MEVEIFLWQIAIPSSLWTIPQLGRLLNSKSILAQLERAKVSEIVKFGCKIL